MHARELNHCLTGEASDVAGGLIAQCLREDRVFPDYAELVSALRQQYQVGEQEDDALCWALEVQLEPIKMEYYSVCTLIRSDEQDCHESALEASPELISQSALWELQSCSNTAGYLAVRKEFFASSLVFITPWIRLHYHQLHGPSSTVRPAMTSVVED